MITVEVINRKLDSILDYIESQNLPNKEIYTLKEAAKFLGISESSLYKKTSKRAIPYSAPSNGKIYFTKSDLINYLKSNRISSSEEITTKAMNHLNQSK